MHIDLQKVRHYSKEAVSYWPTVLGLTAALSAFAGALDLGIRDLPRESYNPRIEANKPLSVREKIIGYPLLGAYRAGIPALEAMGYASKHRTNKARELAFKAAGIDPENPEDDAKRFQLYSQLGFAVRQTDNPDFDVNIPFSVWQKFLKEHGVIIRGWEPGMYTGTYALEKALFKADSKKQGGNENGVVEDAEWLRALHSMGYITDDVINRIAKSVTEQPPDYRKEIEQMLDDLSKNPRFVGTGRDPKIPLETLVKYADAK